MKIAVQIGAGNIGRGFMAQIFHDSGYEVVFVEARRDLVEAINLKGRYHIELADNSGSRFVVIDRIRAVSGLDTEAAAAIAGADLMAVSVGVTALEKVVPMLAAGLRKRWRDGNFAVSIIFVCENLIHAPEVLQQMLVPYFNPDERILLEKTVRLIETSIGRMVPGAAPQGVAGNHGLLDIRVEPYCKLPADKDGFRGEIPALKYLEPYSPFLYIIERKLYIHNAGHAAFAYLGYLLKLEYIWQAVEDPVIRRIVSHYLYQAAQGLVQRHHAELDEVQQHIDDLLVRFSNRALGDTTERVGRDPRRKLGPEDRIIGAYRLLKQYNLDISVIPLIIAAALHFDAENDPGAAWVRKRIAELGVADAVNQICGLDSAEAEELLPEIGDYYFRLGEDPGRCFSRFAARIT